MKITKILKYLFFFGFLLFSGYAFAQENLIQWIKECEKDKTVDMTVIDNKFPDTRKPDSYVVKITLKENSHLQALMHKAYEKDKPDAYSAIDKRVNGVMVPSRCEFSKVEADKTVTQTIFDFYPTKTGETVVTMFKTFDSTNMDLRKKRNRWFEGG
jgi:hypothetical protein